MKNIYLIPTESPSKIILRDFDKKLSLNTPQIMWYGRKHHFYIISDEKVKGKDWCVNVKDGTIHQYIEDHDISESKGSYTKKIILTSDRHLINQGVQELSNEVIEWLVKNPKCEVLDIHRVLICNNCGQEDCNNLRCNGSLDTIEYYPIIDELLETRMVKYVNGHMVSSKPVKKEKIIEKEENKDGSIIECIKDIIKKQLNTIGELQKIILSLSRSKITNDGLLEDAANNWVFEINGDKWSNNNNEVGDNYGSFVAGARWREQLDNLYSEDEVRKLLNTQRGNSYVSVLKKTNNEDIALAASTAPEPAGGKWVKSKEN